MSKKLSDTELVTFIRALQVVMDGDYNVPAKRHAKGLLIQVTKES